MVAVHRMLVSSICGLDKLGLSVMVTDGAFVAAMAILDNKVNPSKVTRPAQHTLDTTNWLCVGGFGVTVCPRRQTDAKACVPRAVSLRP